IEWDLVAIEERLIRGHRLDHVDAQPLVVALELRQQVGERCESRLADEGCEPAFDQILLVGRQHEAGAVLEELAEIIVIERRHDLSPRNSRTIFGPISSSGSTAEQTPAFAAAPGMPHTMLVVSSCAITVPPAATISSA